MRKYTGEGCCCSFCVDSIFSTYEIFFGGKLVLFLKEYYVRHCELAVVNGHICYVGGVEKACEEFVSEVSFGEGKILVSDCLHVLDELLMTYYFLCDVCSTFGCSMHDLCRSYKCVSVKALSLIVHFCLVEV